MQSDNKVIDQYDKEWINLTTVEDAWEEAMSDMEQRLQNVAYYLAEKSLALESKREKLGIYQRLVKFVLYEDHLYRRVKRKLVVKVLFFE